MILNLYDILKITLPCSVAGGWCSCHFPASQIYVPRYHLLLTPDFKIFLKKFTPLLPINPALFTFTNHTYQKGRVLKQNCWHKAKEKVFFINIVNREAQGTFDIQSILEGVPNIRFNILFQSSISLGYLYVILYCWRWKQGRPKFLELISAQKYIPPYLLKIPVF